MNMSFIQLEGVINLDKPSGISSARAVAQVRRLLPGGTRIGHAGTLDPFATGVLLLLVGRCTRACEQLMDLPKQYQAVVKLGATTATDDPTAAERPLSDHDPAPTAPSLDRIEAALVQFTGTIIQRPPDFSAVHVGGRRAYELSRRGQPVLLRPRRVRVDQIQLLSYQWPLLELRIDCGRGTYIRSIARDVGVVLGTGAYLSALRRTRIGPFAIEKATSLDQIRQDGPRAHIVSWQQPVHPFGR